MGTVDTFPGVTTDHSPSYTAQVKKALLSDGLLVAPIIQYMLVVWSLSLFRLSAQKTPAPFQAAKAFGLRDRVTPVFKTLRSIQFLPSKKTLLFVVQVLSVTSQRPTVKTRSPSAQAQFPLQFISGVHKT
jgi:hypothetical protein